MSNPEKLFVVVDPNDHTHIALERAIITSSIRSPRPKLHVFVAVDAEAIDTRAVNTNLFRHEDWFKDEIREPLQKAGLDYEIELSWSTEWQESIVQAARRFGADNIFIPVHAKSKHSVFRFSESKWDLLKNANCPVVLIRPGAKEQRKVILAAVNFQANRDIQKELNQKILDEGKRWAEGYGAEFHVVNGYLDSMNYPDRGKLANQTGLLSDNIHVKNGYTDEVVSAVAESINADLIVMGTLGQNGMIKSRRGNTAERLIAAVDDDVMVINHG